MSDWTMSFSKWQKLTANKMLNAVAAADFSWIVAAGMNQSLKWLPKTIMKRRFGA
jgi:hypothetical protein